MIGKTVGRFRVLERLGQGGMATVWRAQDELQHRTVALKLLKEELAEQPGARLRFEHEAKTASLLDHPSIAAVYDWGEFEGRLYLAMTYVDGSTVSALAKSRLLPIEECLRIVEAAADALGHAHDRRIIHRDVTARNIMVAKDGRVYVLDFGIALVADLTRLTTTGKVFGTAAYIAPEILLHKAAGPASDLYSLGVVLFEALTGRVPFEGERSEVLVLESLRRPAPPPSSLRPAVPPPVDELTRRLLEADPAMRFGSAEELLAELREVLHDLPRGTSAARPTARIVAAPEIPGASDAADERRRPMYLGILPARLVAAAASPALDASLAQRAGELESAAAAAAAVPNQVHVVRLSEVAVDPEPAALRDFGRKHGVNAVLASKLHVAESSLRLVYHIVDTESGVQIGGDRVAGSAVLPFELEDAYARSLRNALSREQPSGMEPGWPGLSSAALEDRYQQAIGYLRRFDNVASVDGAIAILTELTQLAPSQARFHAALARAFIRKHSLTRQRSWEAQAMSACDAAVRMAPGAPEVTLAQGEMELLRGRWESALAMFEEHLRANPVSYEGRIGRAQAHEGLGRTRLSLEEFREAAETAPEDWRAFHELAMIQFRHGEYEEAAASWRHVTQVTPDNAGAHRNLGSALFHLDRFEEAESAFRRSIKMRPDFMAYSNLGTVLYFQEQFLESVECFQHAVDLNPADAKSWGNLGNACRLAGEPAHRIESALRRAVGLMQDGLERNPEFAEGWAHLADWQLGLGAQAGALASLERALTLAPGEARCQWVAAQVHAQIGDREKVIHHLRLAVRDGYRIGTIRRDPYFAAYRSDPEFLELMTAQESAGTRHTKKNQEAKKRAVSDVVRKKGSLAQGGRT